MKLQFRKQSQLLPIAVAAVVANSALAAVSAEEAKQLGTTLTAFGAEKAGNKEGTIPAYTAEAIKIPACYNPKEPGNYCDPWNDKPLFTITAQNAAEHADKLTPGRMQIFKQYPNYKMNIYPTRRTMVYPKYVLDNTLKNATSCKSIDNATVPKLSGCYGGVPFPIPKNGTEVIWNHNLKYASFVYVGKTRSIFVDATGRAQPQADTDGTNSMFIFDPNKSGLIESGAPYYGVRLDYFNPPRRNGEKLVLLQTVDNVSRAYQYIPGQRRVKLAPDLAYDTPSPLSGGGATVDENLAFYGAMDRYSFKLMGKEEKYIQYNNFGLSDYRICPQEVYVHKNFPNPVCTRWELHRVWHVRATLKPGFRHIMPKRDMYFDEDQPVAGTQDTFDASGNIYHVDDVPTYPFYDQGYGVAANSTETLDLQTGGWAQASFYGVPGFGIYPNDKNPPPASFWSPEALAGGGVR